MTNELIHQGLTQSKNDYYLFFRKYKGYIILVVIYVDNIILTMDSNSQMNTLKHHFHTIFNIKDLGGLHYFLGIEVHPTLRNFSHTKELY